MDVERTERAWAAGFFDGEGWAAQRKRGVMARVNQASHNGVPEVLERFWRVVGAGRIGGPYVKCGRKPLYRWIASSRGDVRATLEAVAPWIGEVKRAELESAVGKGSASEWGSASRDEKLAWAAGLFDGEGWTGTYAHRTHEGYVVLEMGVTQEGHGRMPEVLTRFGETARLGRVYGPYVTDSGQDIYRWKAHRAEDVVAMRDALGPFLGAVKRSQADAAISRVTSQPKLPRGNPAWGSHKTHCVRGHEYAAARLRPFVARKTGGIERRASQQCLECVREYARARRAKRLEC